MKLGKNQLSWLRWIQESRWKRWHQHCGFEWANTSSSERLCESLAKKGLLKKVPTPKSNRLASYQYVLTEAGERIDTRPEERKSETYIKGDFVLVSLDKVANRNNDVYGLATGEIIEVKEDQDAAYHVKTWRGSFWVPARYLYKKYYECDELMYGENSHRHRKNKYCVFEPHGKAKKIRCKHCKATREEKEERDHR